MSSRKFIAAVAVVAGLSLTVAPAPTAQAADAPTVNFKVAVNGDTVTGTAITSGIAVCNLAITDTNYVEMFTFPVHSPVGADGTLTFTKSGLAAGNYFFGGSCFSVDWEPVGGVVPFTIAPTTDPVDPVDPVDPTPIITLKSSDFRIKPQGFGKVRLTNRSKWTVSGSMNGGTTFVLMPGKGRSFKTTAKSVSFDLWVEDADSNQLTVKSAVKQKAPKVKKAKVR